MASFNQPGTLHIGIIAAVVLHATAAFGLFGIAAQKAQPASNAVPIMVSMITAPVPEPVRPPEPVVVPQPVPVVKPPEPVKKKIIVAEKPVAQPAEAAPAPTPPPVAAPTPPPAAAPSQASNTPVTEPAPAAPVPPSFDAAYLDNPSPAYPAMSRRMQEQGRVILRVFVNADGTAGEIELHTSSGADRLDQSALDTVRRWRFVPAKQGNEAVAAWVLVPISFSL
ncbi:MAG: energy transducer TonB [Pseudomonadota bacterium]